LKREKSIDEISYDPNSFAFHSTQFVLKKGRNSRSRESSLSQSKSSFSALSTIYKSRQLKRADNPSKSFSNLSKVGGWGKEYLGSRTTVKKGKSKLSVISKRSEEMVTGVSGATGEQ
jgi:hypothetical protein